MKLFIAGLPYDLDDAELEEIFEKFGPVVSARVTMDKETGKSKGFGFVEMETREDGQEALSCLNDINLGKKPLVVKEAEDRRSAPPTSGNFRQRTPLRNDRNDRNDRDNRPDRRDFNR